MPDYGGAVLVPWYGRPTLAFALQFTTAALRRRGLPGGPAVAGVLTYRLLAFWLPIAPAAVTFQVLQRRHVI